MSPAAAERGVELAWQQFSGPLPLPGFGCFSAGWHAREPEIERLRQREAALRRLYDASMKCWEDDANETPGHVKDPWLWADWITAIEEAGAVLAQPEKGPGE